MPAIPQSDSTESFINRLQVACLTNLHRKRKSTAHAVNRDEPLNPPGPILSQRCSLHMNESLEAVTRGSPDTDPCSAESSSISSGHSLAVLPPSVGLQPLGVRETSLSVLLPRLELALVRATIWPSELSVARLLVMLVLTLVDSAILPDEFALARLVALTPLASVRSPILPGVDTGTVDIAFRKLTLVSAAIDT